VLDFLQNSSLIFRSQWQGSVCRADGRGLVENGRTGAASHVSIVLALVRFGFGQDAPSEGGQRNGPDNSCSPVDRLRLDSHVPVVVEHPRVARRPAI
jgi:hypothetical protein